MSHCIYGADADLIMLGLTTHLPNLVIFREICEWKKPVSRAAKRDISKTEYEFVYINMVREYMDLEF